MGKNLVIASFLLLILSCGKETFQSKPQLTLKSVSSTVVPPQGNLQIIMRLTDKEGDFVDTLWVQKITTRCPSSNFRDSILYRIPSETPRKKNFDGDVVVTFTYPSNCSPAVSATIRLSSVSG